MKYSYMNMLNIYFRDCAEVLEDGRKGMSVLCPDEVHDFIFENFKGKEVNELTEQIMIGAVHKLPVTELKMGRWKKSEVVNFG